jgi:Xaa-Pro aminopeptidase
VTKEKIAKLREELAKAMVDGYILPSNDEFFNEYVPKYLNRLQWLTGFTGSYGRAVILKHKAALFTDGRYILQAMQQLDKDVFEIYDINGSIKITDWLPDGSKIAYDPRLFTKHSLQTISDISIPIEGVIEKIRRDSLIRAKSAITIYPLEYAGEDFKEKIRKISSKLECSDYLFLFDPHSICWLLNIRAHDLQHTPLLLCYALISKQETVCLFVHDKNEFGQEILDYFGDCVAIYNFEEMDKLIVQIDKEGVSIEVNNFKTPTWFFNKIKNAKIIENTYHNSVIEILKSTKNPVEIEGARKAHILDAIAVCKFWQWLEENLNKIKINEISIAEKLLEYRKKSDLFVIPSFATIAGFREHGAIIHYCATNDSNKEVVSDGILLVDSGGQYYGGTTDITRTIAVGTASSEQKENYTRVLKGHINLSMAKFPENISGHQLDVIARYHLWQSNLNYNHGTGHGIGSFLSVHEGPHNISQYINYVALKPGMLLSNEPGYYKEGEYGIRIENVVLVCQDKPGFLRFDTLTLVPYDRNLIVEDMLTKDEKIWLNNYYKSIREKVKDQSIEQWLKEKTREFTL